MGAPWWQRVPGRLREELKSLRSHNIQYEVDRARFEAGQLSVSLVFHYSGTSYNLRAVYPETYPYFAPAVFAPANSFTFHQHAFGANLCLLGGKGEQWWTQWTLAEVLIEQFPKLVEANTKSRDATAALEVDQGEPAGSYYTTTPTAVVLVDGTWTIPTDVRNGPLLMGYYETAVAPELSLAAVLRVESPQRETLCSMPDFIAEKFKTHFWTRWMRVDAFVKENTPEGFRIAISKVDERMAKPRWKDRCGEKFDIIGVTFSEEVQRACTRDGWVFLLHTGKQRSGRHAMQVVDVSKTLLVRAERVGTSNLQARIPELRIAAEKKTAVVGLGCIGAPLALELAKAGSSLVLVDSDKVELGPSARWPLGLPYVGIAKVHALRVFAEKQWPLTTIEAHARDIGADWYKDQELLNGADLLIDATAKTATQRYLGDIAAVCGKTLILVSASPGGWGGRIARFLPDRSISPCPVCLWLYETEGQITKPYGEGVGLFQVEGCRDLTFHGPSFDIEELSLGARRLGCFRRKLAEYSWAI